MSHTAEHNEHAGGGTKEIIRITVILIQVKSGKFSEYYQLLQ